MCRLVLRVYALVWVLVSGEEGEANPRDFHFSHPLWSDPLHCEKKGTSGRCFLEAT